MWIDLQEVRENRGTLDISRGLENRDIRIDKLTGTLESPGHFDLTVSLKGDRVRVLGRVRAVLSLVCVRCLDAFRFPVDKDVDVEYVPDPADVTDGEEIELRYEDLGVGFYRDDRIDLVALVTEQLLDGVPMKPVCGEDCRGLCPQCGCNRNRDQCDCRFPDTDPRLEVLKEIRKRIV